MRPRDSQDNSVHRAQLLLCSFLAPHFSAYGLKIFNVSFRIWIANVMEHCLDPKLSKEVFKTVEQMLRHMFFSYLDLGFLLVCESRGFRSEHVVPGVLAGVGSGLTEAMAVVDNLLLKTLNDYKY